MRAPWFFALGLMTALGTSACSSSESASDEVEGTSTREESTDGGSSDEAGASDTESGAEDTLGPSDTESPQEGEVSSPDEEEFASSEVEGDPGRVTIHRLNRAEYNHTVRDLLGTTQTPADNFPSDDHGYGYDNNADVLAMSPLLFEFYEYAANALLDEALFKPIVDPINEHFEVEVLMADAPEPVGGAIGDWGWNFWSSGSVTTPIVFPASGTYRLSVHGYGQQAGPDPTRASFTVNGLAVGTVDITATSAGSETYSVEVEIEANEEGIVGVGFINDYYIHFNNNYCS